MEYPLQYADGDEARIHGGALKIYRIDATRKKLYEARYTKDWYTVIMCLDTLYTEIKPLLDQKDEQIQQLYSETITILNQIQQGRPVPNIYGITKLLEFKIVDVIHRHKLDMELKPKKQKKTSMAGRE